MSYVVPSERPKACGMCLFARRSQINYGKCWCALDATNTRSYAASFERLDNCPLIEIPTPHGDLVDLSDMVHPNDSMRRMTIDEQLRRTCEGWSADRKQYVVIEAERSETDAYI